MKCPACFHTQLKFVDTSHTYASDGKYIDSSIYSCPGCGWIGHVVPVIVASPDLWPSPGACIPTEGGAPHKLSGSQEPGC